MSRWLFLGCSLMVVGAWALVDPPRDAEASELGGVCESTRECRAGTRCVDSAGVIEGQCSASCSENTSCQAEFGVRGLCLGADLCARACTGAGATDCARGTVCNAYGWCERVRH